MVMRWNEQLNLNINRQQRRSQFIVDPANNAKNNFEWNFLKIVLEMPIFTVEQLICSLIESRLRAHSSDGGIFHQFGCENVHRSITIQMRRKSVLASAAFDCNFRKSNWNSWLIIPAVKYCRRHFQNVVPKIITGAEGCEFPAVRVQRLEQ